ncbi:SulP family inorganic anion transporter [Pyxidicoccus trucidator]|uniref:SulP family inorganic anion transporter n=1 Tax=Pyxidicoccus trucidator TaxID=2709662 RepID=UPI0013DC8C67|nr:SulP family inorganic anion transporter [Pyxidicoccus trucidator]
MGLWTGRIWQGAQRVVPGLRLAMDYPRRWLRPDFLSALTIGAMLVPQGLAYAQIVGVRPVAGLYAGAAGMLAYALFGPSRHLILGPEAGAAILTATALAPLTVGADPARYASLAALLALMVAGLSLLAGLLKAGGLADFLSKPILIGYTNGAALIIIGSQLARMVGLERKSDAFFGQVWEVGMGLPRLHVLTLLFGMAIIAALVLLRRFLPRIPGPLILVVLTTAVAQLFQLRHGGLQVVGTVEAEPPAFGFPALSFADVRALLPAAFSIALVNYASSVLTGRIYADRNHYRLDSNQEFFGQAAGNLASALVQGFPVTGSDSRSAVNDAMGGRSQLVGVCAAVLVTVFALFLTPLLENLPLVTLGAIVIVAAVYLMDFASVLALWRVRRVEAFLAVATMLGVLLLGILQGILIAVALALVDLVRRAAHPHDAVLGRREGMPGWLDLTRHKEARAIPGLIVYRFDAPMFFANARHLRERVRELVAASRHPVEEVILDASSVYDLDVTAADGLEKLRGELEERGIVLVIGDANAPLRIMLRRTGLMDRLGSENVFLTVEEAVLRFLETHEARTAAGGESGASPVPPAVH